MNATQILLLLAPLRAKGVLIDEGAAERLTVHGQQVLSQHGRLHLVSDGDTPRLAAVHFGDCIALAAAMASDLGPGAHHLDVGSGGGFPGLVLAALFPSIRVTLLERSAAKAGFLRHTADKMGLADLEVVEGEFPGAAADLKPYTVTARAVERPERFAKAFSRWAPPGVRFWCQSPLMVPVLRSPMFHVEPWSGPAKPRSGLWRISRNVDVPRGT